MPEMLLDRAGRRRSPATMPGFHAGRSPRNKGLRYPADPPKVEEIVAVMRAACNDAHGRRLRGLIVVLWRAALRIQEALAPAEAALDDRRGALLVRGGKGGRRREVGGTLGLGRAPAVARTTFRASPSALCSVCSTAGRLVASGRPPLLELSCAARPSPRVSVDASLHISYVTPTPSRWLAKAWRS